jgi:predicted transcriptional regulator
LSEEQRQVLECLRTEGGGLTARQIQSRLACSPAVVENALVVLLERQFISRLNTLIPSYGYRLDGAAADDD